MYINMDVKDTIIFYGGPRDGSTIILTYAPEIYQPEFEGNYQYYLIKRPGDGQRFYVYDKIWSQYAA